MNANASNFDPSAGSRRQSHGTFYPSNTTGGAQFYVDSQADQYDTAAGGAMDQNQQYHQHGSHQNEGFPPQFSMGEEYQSQSSYSEWGRLDASPCYFYPTAHLAPQLYGAPISALSYDDQYTAIYVASHTQSSSERRLGRRASMLVTHNTLDGMLYSSCAGHPEVTASSLSSVYETFFGGGGTSSPKPSKLPPHAYRPPYGENLNAGFGVQSFHLGITTLLPFKGYAASVSPSAVRVHSHGGLCMSDHEIEGMVCGTPHPNHNDSMAHVSVGGMALGSYKAHVHCMDVYQGLRIISSNSFRSESESRAMGVMSLATNYHKQTIVAGCSDGTIRLLDGSWRKRGGSELAKIKSHSGGVTNVAVSQDGNLMCTTGFASRPSASVGTTPYAYPDQHVLLYDVRYLGRGGVVHSFSGIRGGPRFISFLPDVQSQPSNRILVASGQKEGGMQIIVPFDQANDDPASFLMPQLSPGESITAMHVSDDRLALGTSQSNVLQYELRGFDKSTLYEKDPLVVPSYTPERPAVSIPPSMLRSFDPGVRAGANEQMKSIFSSYLLCANPAVSNTDKARMGTSAFVQSAQRVLVASSKRNVSEKLTSVAVRHEGDFLATVPVSNFDVDLLAKHDSSRQKEEIRPLLNPNKLLYSKLLAELCYDDDANRKQIRRGKTRHNQNSTVGSNSGSGTEETLIPSRYRLTLRPSFVAGSHFDHAEHNDTGLWPGWDYSLFMPNSYVVGVLVMLYFEPQVRSAMIVSASEKASSLSMELGFLFHQIESMSRYALVHPGENLSPRIGAMTPANFITSFAVMPEAEALALVDGSPEAVDRARRPEAFYRFLLHHLDKELSGKKNADSGKLLDSLHGLNFVSANEFITGSSPPTMSSQRHLTVTLAYDPFLRNNSTHPSFGEVLQHALCRETRLRAWSSVAKAYETIVQRKIVTSLPHVLSLSCACAGRKEEEGLSIWRGSGGSDKSHWLPESVEVEMQKDGNVTVRELVKEESGEEIWRTIQGKSSIPSDVAKLVSEEQHGSSRRRYRLDAVLSFVRDEMDPAVEEQLDAWSTDRSKGHHVLHVRQPSTYKRLALQKQVGEAERLANEKGADSTVDRWTLTAKTGGEVFRKRAERVAEQLASWSSEESSGDDWVIFNGFVVSKTVVEDARAFHVPFKEPSLVVFRAIDADKVSAIGRRKKKPEETLTERPHLPPAVLQTRSLSTGEHSPYAAMLSSELPGKGDLVAFDAEFVSLQEEESVLTDAGSKVTARETRYALARISILSCATRKILIDDHVLPREPVVDYLTRFSGIVEGDLDPKTSPHHLISTRSAYLKLRFLQERGCIFVGHGLSQDFLTANLYVPPSQIIDTVELYHKRNMRYVSLRFLTNFVLKRDMQQDVHDSVEDARAAYELLQKAQEFEASGAFEQVLTDLYEYGQKTDWKLGVDEEDE